MEVYRERAHLVKFLSRLFRSVLTHGEDPAWPIIYIDTPSGQLSWHISENDLDLFGHVPWSNESGLWDGHTTEEKYERLMELGLHYTGNTAV